MPMSRAILSVMAGLLCALAGMRYAASLQGDALRLSRWEQVLRHLELLLREGTLSIPDALCAAADEALPPDNLLRDMAARLSASPLTSLREAYQACSGPCPEQTVLSRLFDRMGRGTKESRCLAVQQGSEEIALLARSAQAKADKDVKLYRTLGLVGGACLTILLL
ncbi:MAG: hypothetical protein PUC00_11515 [Clostridiales bacterium]|nr:hypothetical protein [Clostridiales bacterium]